jgi:alpha-N-acetylglucosaminidase
MKTSNLSTLILQAFDKQNASALKSNADEFLELLADMESLLSTDSRFMLGPWLEMAKSVGGTDEEKDLYEYNARNQVRNSTCM